MPRGSATQTRITPERKEEHNLMSIDNTRQRDEDARKMQAIYHERRMDHQARLRRASDEHRWQQREYQHRQEQARWRQTEESRRNSHC
jgi:CRISPR/Cas system-associated endonuclease/helicase Cas3